MFLFTYYTTCLSSAKFSTSKLGKQLIVLNGSSAPEIAYKLVRRGGGTVVDALL